MFNNVALDVFIGLVFVFLLYSLLATIVQEMIATRLAFRSKVLEKAILRMLEDIQTDNNRPFGDRIDSFLHLLGLKNVLKKGNIAPWFYAHPLIAYLGEDNYYSKPAYIDASNFSKVMIDLLKGFNQPESQMVQSIHNSITAGIIHKLPINIANVKSGKLNPAIKILRAQNTKLPDPVTIASETVSINTNTALFLRSLWQESGADVNTFKLKLEQWFDDTMGRATGWYKRYTRVVLFVIGLIIAYVFNVDSIAIHRILSTNKTAREQMVQMAIKNKDNLNPANYTSQNDSILRATYQMVAKDANDANDVLGLGTPWKDSCKICKSFKDSSEIRLLVQELESLKTEKDNIDKWENQYDLLKMNYDSSSMRTDSMIALNKRSDSLIIESVLKMHNKNGLSDSINSLTVLFKRCPDILKQTKGTCFKYSPNQSGGLETVLGWLITALAITLGAPFWFGLLSKLISLRGSGNKTTPTTDDNSNKTGAAVPVNPVTVNVNPNTGGEAIG